MPKKKLRGRSVSRRMKRRKVSDSESDTEEELEDHPIQDKRPKTSNDSSVSICGLPSTEEEQVPVQDKSPKSSMPVCGLPVSGEEDVPVQDKSSKSSMPMCGLSCRGEEGVPPQLQCIRCLSLFHASCVSHKSNTYEFLCNNCTLGTLQIKLEPLDSTDMEDTAGEQNSAIEAFNITIKKEPEDSPTDWMSASQGCDLPLTVKSEPVDPEEQTEKAPDSGWNPFLWSGANVLGELPLKRSGVPGVSTSHILPLPSVFAEKINQHKPLVISMKGVKIKVPPFGCLLFQRPDVDFFVVLNAGVIDTVDKNSADGDDFYSFIASCNPSDPQNIILQEKISRANEISQELNDYSTTMIRPFGTEEEYSPLCVCNHCQFICKRSEGKIDITVCKKSEGKGGNTVMSFTCKPCMALRNSIITEDFKEPQHVPTDPRSRSILDLIDAQKRENTLANAGSGANGKSNIALAQRGHLVKLPNRLLDRTKLTQPLVMTINGHRASVPPNGKVLLSKQYGAHVFFPETLIKSVGIRAPQLKSFIIMVGPNDPQNLVIQETGSKMLAKPQPSYQTGFFQTEMTAAMEFESAYKLVFNKEPTPPPPVIITDSGELSADETPKAPYVPAISPYHHKGVPLHSPIRAIYIGYTCFLKIMGFVSVKDRLSARQVCKEWKEMLMHYSMWHEISLRDCLVTDWKRAADFMSKVNTRSLDLRGLVHCHGDDNRTWHEFIGSLGRLAHLEDIEFDKCPAIVLMTIAGKLPNLRSLSALQLTAPGSSATNSWNITTQIDITKIACNFPDLEMLHVRGVCALLLTDGLTGISELSYLKELSLTTVQNLTDTEMEVIGSLRSIEVLELGDCDSISDIGLDELRRLTNLTRLRLEYRPCSDSSHLAKILVCLKNLCHLELVKFIMDEELMLTIKSLEQLQSLVIWPETGEEEAEDNTAVLRTLSEMTFLERLEWGISTNKPKDSAQTALFVDDSNPFTSAKKSPLRIRSKTMTISKVMNDLCSNLTETKIKVFKLKMPQVKQLVHSPNATLATQSASLRYVLNFLKSKAKPDRSMAASRQAQRL